MSFDKIPAELREYRQFVNWRFEQRVGSEKPTKVPYSPLGFQASVTAPQTWGSFEEAVAACQSGGFDGIGFVFTAGDPFVGIDMDDCGDDRSAFNRQVKIAQVFGGYQEVSPSGRGLQIIVRGSVPSGRRRAKVELYPHGRFFTMTGNVHHNGVIENKQDLLQLLYAQMGDGAARQDDGFDGPEREPDSVIVDRMFAAVNGAKARDLFEGRWKEHYPNSVGPSEADFALIDIIAFYSDNRAQVTRLFGRSQLGQREKAGREAYVSNMVSKSFDRKLPPVDSSAVIERLKADIEAQRAAKAAGLPEFDVSADPTLPTIDVGDFDGCDVSPREWLVEGWIPAKTVTLISGDGGTGKSLLAAQLCASTVLGIGWVGSEPLRQGSALFVTAEDDVPEVHRRMVDIASAAGVTTRDLRGLAVVSLADRDALLAVPGRARGTLEPTPLYAALARRIAVLRPAVVVIDTLADTFGGNEIDRSQARQFIAFLRKLAIEFETTVVVLAHPSQSGMTSGSGTSGSTGWSNSVRSRIFMKRDENNPFVRVLELMKANYGTIGEQIRVQWGSGVFCEVDRAASGFAHMQAAKSAVDEQFLELLADFTARGFTLSPQVQSPTRYAPKMMASHADANGTKAEGFKAAMIRLLANGRIKEEVEVRHRRETTYLVAT